MAGLNKYKAYPEYKDSGVEWLGEIPKHWAVCRLKNLATIKNGQDYKSVQAECGYPVIGSGGQFMFASKYMYDKPSVLLGRKGTIDKPLYINEPFWTVDTMYYTELNDDVDAKYFYYLALTIQFSRYSTNTALPSMTQEHLSNYKFAAPKVESDRKQITDFLDHETAKIDNLIEKQQQLINLLKEKRQAVISHAVTKGLNPDVPMKDSGVEWLGEVPKHWVVSGFKKYLASIVDYRGKTPNKIDDGILLVTARNIKKGMLDYTLSEEFIASSDYKEVMSRGVPNIGDVLFTTEAPLGEVANVDRTDIALAQRIIKFNGMASFLDNYYFKYFIMSSAFQQSLNLYSSGSTAQGIKAERFVYLRKLLPPMKEQRQIVNFLDKETCKIDVLVEKQFSMLSLLQERRTALISAAVTGKIDVRNWVAPDTQEVEVSQEAAA
ncbi:restriction endonuclease subunit S [Xenorhabdus bovienii]|uniref:restriction endonuclease subunit S n=1 Tax=Xenorhabdus bovienii TaxID=40576 RepID=UPI003DA62ED0